MNADEILKALQSGKLSNEALRVISRAVFCCYLEDPISWQCFVDEIEEINKPVRERVDDYLKQINK